MKKLLFMLTLFSFLLIACTNEPTVEPEPTPEVNYTVTFNSQGGNDVSPQTVVSGQTATEPTAPTKEGYVFNHWYLTDENVAYVFSTPVTSNITLNAKWTQAALTNAELIAQDIDDLESKIILNEYQLNLPIRGAINKSTITWKSNSEYISNNGIVLPARASSGITEGEIVGTFTLNGLKVTHTFLIPIPAFEEVEIASSRLVPFENVTTEYDVADGEVNLYFEEDGSVPYIKVMDFFGLLEGFIDPEVEFTVVKGESTLEISYQYYDEDFDELYDLILTIDANENTITTNDPGFYWAYVYSTETNYGRHINYVADHPDNYQIEGDNVVYDLDQYFMDIAVYEGEIVLPYYIVNQLFAGSSYYNVYYNYDGLFGIYSLPSAGTPEYRAIKTSSKNNTDIPADLLVHTFNMLAFNMDYFYGLKDIMEVDTYYDVLYEQRNSILNDDPEDFDYAIRDFLLKSIDEPHTSYGYPSYFNRSTWTGPEQNQLSYYGPRFQQWYYAGYVAVDDAIEAKWGTNPEGGWNAYGPNRPRYWFLDDVTVSIMLDDFNTADIEESAAYDALIAEKMIKSGAIASVLPDLLGGNKYFYYNSSDETNDMLEILVKGLTADAVNTYGQALISLGYTFVSETTTDQTKVNGYYTKVVGDVTYMVQLGYSTDFNLFYVGIKDKAPAAFTDAWPFVVNINDTVVSDSAVYLEMIFDKILAERPLIENVLLDLSWNTGGNVGALYRIVGFITDQPFAVSGIDGDTGGASTYHVQIDGVPNYAHLNWGLLITPVTFSAANSMATIFMENDLGQIIGVQSGGGACSITPILLPNGTAFTMSSNNINAYRTGSGTTEDPWVYVNNEFGITPDIVIPITQIYNETTLLQVFE